MNKKQGKVKKFCHQLVNLLCSIFLLLAIIAATVSHTGAIGLRSIQSGSMEPKLPTGSLIITKSVLPSEISSGDVISFSTDSGDTVSHRVIHVGNDNGETKFQTKGDSNRLLDRQAISEQRVLGKVIFHIPFLGYLVQFLQQPVNLFLIIFGILFICILIKLIRIKRNIKSEDRVYEKK